MHCPSFPSYISCPKVYFCLCLLFFALLFQSLYFQSVVCLNISCCFLSTGYNCVLFRLTVCLLVREFSPLPSGMITHMVVIILLSRYLFPVHLIYSFVPFPFFLPLFSFLNDFLDTSLDVLVVKLELCCPI